MWNLYVEIAHKDSHPFKILRKLSMLVKKVVTSREADASGFDTGSINIIYALIYDFTSYHGWGFFALKNYFFQGINFSINIIC